MRPFCENRLSGCHNFTVTRFSVLSLNIKPTNQPQYQSNTTNDSRNTKLQKYKQQLLQVQNPVLLQLLTPKNKRIKQNKTTLCDFKVTMRRVHITNVALQYLYLLNVMSVCLHSCLIDPASTTHVPYYTAICATSG